LGYDAYMVAVKAIDAAGSPDPKKINEVLWGVTYSGVTGDIAFDDIGDAIRDVAYIKSANNSDGSWNFVAIQSVK
jgi:branched-chain amino acid transport system substrate-binding protein